MPLAQGQILQNRYRIVKELGRGGFGRVYLAQDMQQGNRWVAIKEMIPDPNASAHALAQARTQFRREAQVLMSLRHHNLPQVYENFAEGGNEYLVMQYIEGRNLLDIAAADWQQGRTLGESRVLGWAIQIMDALEYLHGQRPYPVLHRDVKPQNIILTPGGELFLVDFGLVKLLDPNNPQTMTALRGLGTPEYAPPEQYATGGTHTGPHSDVYALGATLYHLLTEQPPSTATDRLLPAPMTEPLVPPRQLNPAISLLAEQALVKSLELAPADRFTSVAEMRRALLGQGVAGPATPLPTRRVVPAGWAVGIGVVSFLVMAVLVLVAVLGGGGGIAAVTPTRIAAISTPTDTPTPTATPVLPTNTPTSQPSSPTLVPVELTVTPIPPTDTPTPPPVAGETRAREKDGAVMVHVPAGEFVMGITTGEMEENVAECVAHGGDRDVCEEWLRDEIPQHTVTLDAFWIDQHEVTNAQYRRCVEAGACTGPVGWDDSDFNGPDQPVVRVTWYDAQDYCEWAGARLPTGAEWEKAARGTDGRKYPWGNDFDCWKGNFDDEQELDDYLVPGGPNCDGYVRTAPVGSFPAGASPYGTLDMAGNVWEWVADWYDANYYARSPARNPQGPDSGESKVLRGGAWDNAWDVRSTSSYGNHPTGSDNYDGFRCAQR